MSSETQNVKKAYRYSKEVRDFAIFSFSSYLAFLFVTTGYFGLCYWGVI